MARIAMVLLGDIRYDGRVRKEIQTLTGAGHQVELILSEFKGNGSGGGDLGVPIHYIPITLWPNPAVNFLAQIRFNRQAASIIPTLAPTHIHCHDLTTLLAGVWAKKKTGAKLIFDAHELMPESMGGVRETFWQRIEKRCIKSCDHVVMPEKNRITYFKQKYPEVREVVLLENFPRRADIPSKSEDLFRRIYPIRKDQQIVLYTGLIAAKRHLEELIASIAVSSEEYVLVVLGSASKSYDAVLAGRVKKLGLTKRIFFHDAVPYSQVLRYMTSCNIGTAFYRNTDVNNYYCASNKLYEYIALNKLVLTNNYPGLLERIENIRQGVCLTEVTAKSLQEAYIRVSNPALVTPGIKKFLWEDQEDVLGQLYEN
jgi:starch synthase